MDKERSNTVAGLINKRRELAGRIDHALRELRALVPDLGLQSAILWRTKRSGAPGT